MPSILPDFEYDVFISYRHNDNRNGWVKEFVKHLNEELAATIKEHISVYFDSNLYDGLLETHNVDKSLEKKLRSVIFIPVLSQIYCDTTSFAWQHEFLAFNSYCQDSAPGREVRLKSGNVASRILPIMINHLEQEDTALIEGELNAKLRAIDFTFRSPGVNRPLRKDDKRSENVNHLSYHDQLNKLANAIKEILYALKYPRQAVVESGADTKSPEAGQTAEPSRTPEAAVETALPDEKSIAVLPFSNLSRDPSQEYFSDGITENIIMQLATMSQFRVISRTSVMRYKNTTKSTQEIASELGVRNLLAGSAQSHKDRVRISVQLTDAIRDHIIWSKVFLENMDDIFAIQSNVAEVVADELSASLSPQQSGKLNEVPTKNLEAYDLFLKGRHAFNQWSVAGYKAATEYFQRAIAADREFKEAYSYLASSYSARMSWNGDLAPDEAQRLIAPHLAEVWRRGPTDNDFLTRSYIEFFVQKDYDAAEKSLQTAIEMNGNNGAVYYAYGYLLNMMGRFPEAMAAVEKARSIDPLTIAFFNHWAICLYLSGRNGDAIATVSEALKLYPNVVRFHDFIGRIYLTMGNYEDAVKAITSAFRNTSLRPPSMVAYLARSYAGLQRLTEANELKNELLQRSNAGEKGINIYLAHTCLGLGQMQEARGWLVRARQTNDVDLIWLKVDPLLDALKAAPDEGPSFERAKEHVVDMLETRMPNLPYHNVRHVQDVRDAALKIANTEHATEKEMQLIELAALLHDIGFIQGAKDHEATSARMAQEMLPAFGYQEADIESIKSMIMATKLPQSPTSHLDKILCDADLDYLGRDDFFDIGATLREELMAAGVVESEREWNLVQKTFLESHRYHTAYGKQNREANKQERLKQIVAKLKR